MASKGQFMGLASNRIARLHSQVMTSTCENSLTAAHCRIKAYLDAANQHRESGDAVPVKTHKLTLARHRVSSSSVVRASDQITEGRRFKSHRGLEFFSESSFCLTVNCCLKLYQY